MKSSGGTETFPVRPGFLLAHQGGWDEILLVVGPLLLVGLLLWLANRRVTAQLDQGNGASTTTEAARRSGEKSNPSTGKQSSPPNRTRKGR